MIPKMNATCDAIRGRDIQEHSVFEFYINYTLAKINFDSAIHWIGEKKYFAWMNVAVVFIKICS